MSSGGSPADGRLEELRSELDRIDEALLTAVKTRLQYCTAIARHKSMFDIPVMQADRVDIVQRRAAEFASNNGMDLRFVRLLYDLIIAEACRVENRVIAGRPVNDVGEVTGRCTPSGPCL
jgi:chorismate mutase